MGGKTASSGVFCLPNTASNPKNWIDSDYIKSQLAYMIQ